LTVIKLVIMLLVVYGLSLAFGPQSAHTIAAVVCAAVPTAGTVFIPLAVQGGGGSVTATVSITTLLSVLTLLAWLYALRASRHRSSEPPQSDCC
jgi:predicted permease